MAKSNTENQTYGKIKKIWETTLVLVWRSVPVAVFGNGKQYWKKKHKKQKLHVNSFRAPLAWDMEFSAGEDLEKKFHLFCMEMIRWKYLHYMTKHRATLFWSPLIRGGKGYLSARCCGSAGGPGGWWRSRCRGRRRWKTWPLGARPRSPSPPRCPPPLGGPPPPPDSGT